MKLQYWKCSFHPLLATGGMGALDPIPTIAEAGMCKNLAPSFGLNLNPDPGFGGFSNLGAKMYSPGGFWSIYFFNFPLKDSFIAYSDATQLSFIINQTGRLPWSCDRVRRHRGPHFILTTMLVHRCDSPYGVELACGPRAKNISRIYFTATINQRLVQ